MVYDRTNNGDIWTTSVVDANVIRNFSSNKIQTIDCHFDIFRHDFLDRSNEFSSYQTVNYVEFHMLPNRKIVEDYESIFQLQLQWNLITHTAHPKKDIQDMENILCEIVLYLVNVRNTNRFEFDENHFVNKDENLLSSEKFEFDWEVSMDILCCNDHEFVDQLNEEDQQWSCQKHICHEHHRDRVILIMRIDHVYL